MWRIAGFTLAPAKSTVRLIAEPNNQSDRRGGFAHPISIRSLAKPPPNQPINVNYTDCSQPIKTRVKGRIRTRLLGPHGREQQLRSSCSCRCFERFLFAKLTSCQVMSVHIRNCTLQTLHYHSKSCENTLKWRKSILRWLRVWKMCCLFSLQKSKYLKQGSCKTINVCNVNVIIYGMFIYFN